MNNQSNNPWNVGNIQEFSFLNCPECAFKTKQDYFFQDHAMKNHPLCFVLFGGNNESEKNNLVQFSEVILEKQKNDKFTATDYYIEVKDGNEVSSKVELTPTLIASIDEPNENPGIHQNEVISL